MDAPRAQNTTRTPSESMLPLPGGVSGRGAGPRVGRGAQEAEGRPHTYPGPESVRAAQGGRRECGRAGPGAGGRRR